jgi:hypothetical protein
MADEKIDDSEQVKKYLATAKGLYNLDETAIEIRDPPFIVRTETGAKIAAWLPVDDEDLWE